MANGDENVDVVVVGGGPTGLLMAGELQRRGVAVRLVEKHAQRQQISKALVVQARTLEQMDLLGLAEQFVSRGYPAPGLNMSLDNRRPVSIEMHVLQTRFPYLLVLPQQETENLLEDHLRSCGGSLDRGVEALSVEQDEREVKVRLQGPDNSEAIVPCSYLVACDGAHSTIRKTLSVEFRGREQDYVVFLADVKLSSEFNKARITNFTSARGFLSILPFLGDYARIFSVDYTKQDRSPHDELTLKDLQETVDAIAPFPLKLAEPLDYALSVAKPASAEHALRTSFFVGDAAHAHSPAGGQGMNNGLQDAFNLSWKLAMVIRGEAPESLFDTYDLERHPVDAAAQRKTDLMFASFTLRNPLLKPVRNFVLHSLVPLKRVQARLAGDLSGISVTYRSTSLSRRERRRGRSGNVIGPGDRAPDADLWREGQSERLYELLRAPYYLLIAYGTNETQQRWRDRLSHWLGEVASQFGHALHSVVILDEGFLSEPGGSTPVLIDYKRQFRHAFSPRDEVILLIRPDGYVAVRLCGFDAGGFDAFANWIRARAGQISPHDLRDRRKHSGQ